MAQSTKDSGNKATSLDREDMSMVKQETSISVSMPTAKDLVEAACTTFTDQKFTMENGVMIEDKEKELS